ncbi:MAG: hypothetical protein FWE34_08615 [Defluviitaleaceae bacterium]|nr:hypothetical protein [Defluviitaleaceae bacterium]
MDSINDKYIGDRSLREAQNMLGLFSNETVGMFAQDNDIAESYKLVAMLGGLERNERHEEMTSTLKTYQKINYPENFIELSKQEATDALSFAKELISTIKWK